MAETYKRLTFTKDHDVLTDFVPKTNYHTLYELAEKVQTDMLANFPIIVPSSGGFFTIIPVENIVKIEVHE